MELSDIDELGELRALEAELAELLATDDVVHLAAAMEPGSTAVILIYENLWAAPFASAARRSGGQLIANGGHTRWSGSPAHLTQTGRAVLAVAAVANTERAKRTCAAADDRSDPSGKW